MHKNRKGFFVAIEGIDGAGSSTQTKLLVVRLKEMGYDSVLTKEPNPEGKIEAVIRSFLKEPSIAPELDALLFAADRIHHVAYFIKPWLESGKVVVSDRYLESSIAYQSSQGLDEEWILTINKGAIRPHLTIILDIDPVLSLRRKGELHDRFENVGFLRKVRSKFLERAHRMGYSVIDANRSVEEVHEEIFRLVINTIESSENQ
ncbi:MAG: dTMP kinase [Candidatus Methanomethylicia archaeon]|jgi:dTMP kinase|uniref:Probable thymidylate kinase n=1 Tax=Thermoproteota archaeon TaxID=2056631 RepID=A0A523BG42_9CREN|nr:dTMP kinase [Candidatus Methanomethylicia archaeon]TDA39907.1 MAG: dTMP kinase [Candidatus Verstraetearchaeota archaeon]